MAHTTKFEYKIKKVICIDCYRPAIKYCEGCGLPLCKHHYLIGKHKCESCREDDEN